MSKLVGFFRSLTFKIAMVFILLLLVTVEIIGAYFVRTSQNQGIQNFQNTVNNIFPNYVLNQLGSDITNPNTTKGNSEIQNILNSSQVTDVTALQVVDKNGTIRGDSNINNRGLIGQKTTNSDIKDALYSGQIQKKQVFDRSYGNTYVLVLPIKITNNSSTSNSAVGVVYVRASMESVYQSVSKVMIIFYTASIAAILLAIILAIIISRAMTHPIDDMKNQAIKMANGDYSGLVPVYSNDELGQLAQSINDLSLQIREAQESSLRERNRLDSVLFHMTDGVIATDRVGKISIINERALEFLDLEREEIVGKSILDVLKLSNQYSIRQILEQPHGIKIDENKNNEDELILNVDFATLKAKNGYITGLVCVLHDITEQQKNDREQREFVSNVSHELRTPLTSMRSYLEALEDGAWQDETYAPKFINVSLNETNRMIRMINDLLNLSRLDRGTFKLNLEYIDLIEFTNFIIDRFDMMIQTDDREPESTKFVNDFEDVNKKNYKIIRRYDRNSVWLEVDPDRLMQVIDNIMNNAIKYSPDGGIIKIEIRTTDNNVIFSITDQGQGIPKKERVKIFNRFYRVERARSRRKGGTGLGLAISKEVIEALGGHIWVESKENVGSTFSFSLPYDQHKWSEDLNWEENERGHSE
ncbi:cell wall metabolism sensor histidine kinase WalK [Xylocopilactobacillus apis]|uniref:histidine kinase n=1 Tax=Xylocopilactobacillus apis TaxID=2932183 RepID=A0AAU9DSB3_9LACO|nr:cell wall metabolism sensor histidine kinase WalK [Xylocopilactobacillus apis]BDR56568.1 PAS domain-containing sensor histidine kinase [Xylocopilactobacillus apis]